MLLTHLGHTLNNNVREAVGNNKAGEYEKRWWIGKSKVVFWQSWNRSFLLLYRNLETVEIKWFSDGKTLALIWAGIFCGFPFLPFLAHPLGGMLVFPSPASLKPGNPLAAPRWPSWGFYLFQWKLHEALETSEERAGRCLEAGSCGKETNCQLEGKLPLMKRICVVPVLSWKLVSLWPPPYPWGRMGFEVRKPGVLIPLHQVCSLGKTPWKPLAFKVLECHGRTSGLHILICRKGKVHTSHVNFSSQRCDLFNA